MVNPNKYIRKAIKDAINNTYKVFDTRVPNSNTEKKYVIMSYQSKDIDPGTKCGKRWIATILLDCVCIYNIKGNTGSRVEVDDMENTVSQLTENLVIPNYVTVNQSFSFPPNLDNIGDTQIVYRNFIEITLLLQ